MNYFDLIIIGGGPGGYKTAYKAAKRGNKVALIEKSHLGGTCLNVGCIPTKSLCHSAFIARTLKKYSPGVIIDYASQIERSKQIIDQLREGISVLLSDVNIIVGEASFVNSTTIEVNGSLYSSDKIIIATGSEPLRLNIPGAELALTSDEFLSCEKLPASCVVIGGGVIGVEFASILSSFGCTVTVLEFMPEILKGIDGDVARRLRMLMKRSGVKFITSAEVTGIKPGYEVVYNCKGKDCTIETEQVIMCVGRKAVIPKGLDKLGVDMNRSFIKVDEKMQTNIKGLYAVGDVNGVKMLAHVAYAQGDVAIGEKDSVGVVPAAVFTHPECASVGLSEEACENAGLSYRQHTAYFRSNGKALADDEPDGFVKLLIDSNSNLVLGCHIVGEHASDLISEVALAMQNNLPVSAIADTIHSHPTLGETVAQAAESAII